MSMGALRTETSFDSDTRRAVDVFEAAVDRARFYMWQPNECHGQWTA